MNQIQGNAPKPLSAVELALNDLEKQVTSLKAAVSLLDSRLVPVMMPEPTPAVKPNNPSLSAACPIDEILITQTFRIQNVEEVVQTILGRLAI